MPGDRMGFLQSYSPPTIYERVCAHQLIELLMTASPYEVKCSGVFVPLPAKLILSGAIDKCDIEGF